MRAYVRTSLLKMRSLPQGVECCRVCPGQDVETLGCGSWLSACVHGVKIAVGRDGQSCLGGMAQVCCPPQLEKVECLAQRSCLHVDVVHRNSEKLDVLAQLGCC